MAILNCKLVNRSDAFKLQIRGSKFEVLSFPELKEGVKFGAFYQCIEYNSTTYVVDSRSFIHRIHDSSHEYLDNLEWKSYLK